jgi:UDPglucose 6-dehydrogenase
MSKVGVAGAGYVGLTTGACLADLGNDVCIVDIDDEKVRRLRAYKIPFYEPGLQEMVERNARAGRLHFTDSYSEALDGADFFFIAVSTPEGEGGQADVSQVEAAAASIAKSLRGPLVIVNKSTVPIGTGDMVSKTVKRHNGKADVDVVSNPEFLREGSAVLDFMRPDRVVIGAHKRTVADKVAELYKPLDARILITDVYTAEMIKYASNAFLATRISFINEVARIAERVDADIKVVAEGMGLDRRIGSQFLDAGLGFGGSCFPKDVKALAAIAELYDYHPELLTAVIEINDDMRGLATEKLRECLGTLRNQVVGLLGLAFKPNTDDLRAAPSIAIANLLMRKGAIVRAYDPAAMDAAKVMLPEVEYRKSPYAVARGADALLLVTEWNEFKQLDMSRIKRSMRQPVLVDGRNIYDPAKMRQLGFVYRGIGRN